jgi:CheY-like chemotaxis protein
MSLQNNGRIMVVDDEYDIVHIVRRHLEKWGFNVDTFTNPLYALQMFKEHPDRYSLALLDIRMPEMSGISLAELMLRANPDAKIIIMTAYELLAQDLQLSLPTIKRDDILKKPFTLIQVCNAVKRQLDV